LRWSPSIWQAMKLLAYWLEEWVSKKLTSANGVSIIVVLAGIAILMLAVVGAVASGNWRVSVLHHMRGWVKYTWVGSNQDTSRSTQSLSGEESGDGSENDGLGEHFESWWFGLKSWKMCRCEDVVALLCFVVWWGIDIEGICAILYLSGENTWQIDRTEQDSAERQTTTIIIQATYDRHYCTHSGFTPCAYAEASRWSFTRAIHPHGIGSFEYHFDQQEKPCLLLGASTYGN